VVLEAQASGLPAIVSDAGGPQEIVSDGGTGLVVRRRDVEDLAAAIHSLLDDPGRRQAMGAHARRHAERRTWEAAFREFWEDLADIRSAGV